MRSSLDRSRVQRCCSDEERRTRVQRSRWGSSTLDRTQKEHEMRDTHHALIATAVIALSALTASVADAQYAPGPYGPYRSYYRGPFPYAGTYYSYGADRANPSLSPNGWDL